MKHDTKKEDLVKYLKNRIASYDDLEPLTPKNADWNTIEKLITAKHKIEYCEKLLTALSSSEPAKNFKYAIDDLLGLLTNNFLRSSSTNNYVNAMTETEREIVSSLYRDFNNVNLID